MGFREIEERVRGEKEKKREGVTIEDNRKDREVTKETREKRKGDKEVDKRKEK